MYNSLCVRKRRGGQVIRGRVCRRRIPRMATCADARLAALADAQFTRPRHYQTGQGGAHHGSNSDRCGAPVKNTAPRPYKFRFTLRQSARHALLSPLGFANPGGDNSRKHTLCRGFQLSLATINCTSSNTSAGLAPLKQQCAQRTCTRGQLYTGTLSAQTFMYIDIRFRLFAWPSSHFHDQSDSSTKHSYLWLPFSTTFLYHNKS